MTARDHARDVAYLHHVCICIQYVSRRLCLGLRMLSTQVCACINPLPRWLGVFHCEWRFIWVPRTGVSVARRAWQVLGVTLF